jgi:hypothetical protein
MNPRSAMSHSIASCRLLYRGSHTRLQFPRAFAAIPSPLYITTCDMCPIYRQDVPLPGLGAAEFVPPRSSCTDGAPRRLKIRWGQSLLRLVDQGVEFAVTFRGYVFYSVLQE